MPLRGLWWFYPSFLEFPEGPWGRQQAGETSTLRLWKACLSWLGDHGLNAAFIHLGPFGRDRRPGINDRVRTGWGFHYVLDFQRFPEAAVRAPRETARNRELFAAICAHGRAAGVQVFTHHYNFSATKGFVDAHAEPLTRRPVGSRGELKALELGFCDQKLSVHRNLCWNVPVYRDFMAACWEELLDALPDLAGILVTPGENARCPCVECVGPTDDPLAVYQPLPRRVATLTDFVQRFATTVRARGRQPLVRAWAAGTAGPWMAAFPKGIPYLLKYSVFDALDAGPDPALQAWVRAGHRVICTPEIGGGENGGPVPWRRPGYLPQVVRRSREAGCAGVVACVNSEHGYLVCERPVQFLPTILFAHAAATEGDDRGLSVGWDVRVFGERGAQVHEALVACSEIVFFLPRVVFEPDEGFTWPFPYHFLSGGWPGVLGRNLDAPDWAARELATLGARLELAGREEWRDVAPPEALGGRHDPLAALWDVRQRVAAAADELERLLTEVPDGAEADAELARLGGRLCALCADEWAELLRARVLVAAARSPANATQRAALNREALQRFDASIAALERTIETAGRIPARLVDDSVEQLPRKLDQRRAERAALPGQPGIPR